MMQVIGCKQCGKASLEFKHWYYEVNAKMPVHCEFCRHTHTEVISYHFCSKKCFEEYYIHDKQKAAQKPTLLEEWNKTV